MTVDTSILGSLAADVMEQIEGLYGGEAELGTVAIIAEINVEDDEFGTNVIVYKCSDSRRWIQMGLFEAAKMAVGNGSEQEDE